MYENTQKIIVEILNDKPLERYSFGRKRRFVRQSRMVDENVFMLLHIYKNKFVCIEKLARQGTWANGERDSEETAHVLESIQKESSESVEHISRTLRMLNMIAIKPLRWGNPGRNLQRTGYGVSDGDR